MLSMSKFGHEILYFYYLINVLTLFINETKGHQKGYINTQINSDKTTGKWGPAAQ